MTKQNKFESFSLEKLLDSNAVSGNIYYDIGKNQNHAPHLDLHVNMQDGARHDYRLYNPLGGNIWPMHPGQNVIFRK